MKRTLFTVYEDENEDEGENDAITCEQWPYGFNCNSDLETHRETLRTTQESITEVGNVNDRGRSVDQGEMMRMLEHCEKLYGN